jgi:PAS domain S-box-containing protein/putative nucleotidyltransferase with HDIG domain
VTNLINKKRFVPSGLIDLLRNPKKIIRLTLIAILYLAFYVLLDILTKQFSDLPGIVAWYPPAGLTYALLLAFGLTYIPAVSIALFVDSAFIYRMPQSPLLLVSWALIISLIYGAAALFLRKRIHLDWHLKKLRDVVWFVLTAVVVSAVLAVLSVSSSALSGAIPKKEIILQIFHWWIGETVGVLTVTPFLLIFIIPGLKRFIEGTKVKTSFQKPSSRVTLTAIGQAASIVFVLYWVFIAQAPTEFRPLFLIALPLIWIALQRGFKGTTVAILALNSGVVLTLVLFGLDLSRLEELQLTMIIISVMSLLMGAVVTERRQSEKALQQSEQRFRALIENSSDIVLILNLDFTIAYVSPSTERILGYSTRLLTGAKITDFVDSQDLPELSAAIQHRIQTPGPSPFLMQIRARHADGSYRVLEGMGSNLLDQPGVNGLVLNARDITERKTNEAQIQILSKIPDESPNPILRATTQGRLLYANPSSALLLAKWKTQVGKQLPPELRKIIKEVFNTGKNQEIEVKGNEKFYSLILAPILDAGYVNLYGRDITLRKLAEESTRRHLSDLEMLYENSLSITGVLNPDEIGKRLIETITKKGLSWRHVSVHLYQPETQKVMILVNSYPGMKLEENQTEKRRLEHASSDSNAGFIGAVIQNGESILCNDVAKDSRYIMAYPDIRSGLYVPMKVGDHTIGVLSIESEKENAFSDADEQLLMTLATQLAIAIENARFFEEIERSHRNLTLAYDATIEGWSKALDFRDKETEGHSKRVTEHTWKLARAYGLDKEELVNIRWGALLHDIGKMGIPDAILLKPAPLTALEWRIMRMHTNFAFEWLSPIEYLRTALDIPYCHHEKWNGTGYPRELKGEEIPMAARLFAIVDVYDALTSDRPYRKAWTKTDALNYIRGQSGIHFDPKVVSVFVTVIEKD